MGTESTHDRKGCLGVYETDNVGIHRKEVTRMTDFEIITIFLGVLALMLSSASLLIALLAFLHRKDK